MQEKIKKMLIESADVKRRVAETLSEDIESAAKMIVSCFKSGGKLLIFGNGGSAADAQHFQAELTHQFEIKRRKSLPAISLTTNTSLITAIGNDWGFDEVFERQIDGLAKPGDVVFGITTSGNSENVSRAVKKAKEAGAKTIVLAGKDGGKIKNVADLTIVVPSENTARIQESHLAIYHILCYLIEQDLFGKK